MCGIAGHVSFNDIPGTGDVRAMVNRIRHRGPDDQGLWVSPDQNCIFGHARLSIMDVSSLGHQPMIDSETGNSIVFNGEIYNFQALRKECESKGARFKSNSDTEVILALYRIYGIACLSKLRGMFAFAIWDSKQRRVFLARDRVGKKPLNYAHTENSLIFCSEIDPLVRHPAVSSEMDLESLELYLQLQYIPAPWTIYRSIRKLPPAHFAILDDQGFRIERYWNVDYTQKIQISENDALDALDEKLTESVRLRMISDVPIGALLSGGVDSSLVVAIMAKLNREPIRTYSIGFRENSFNELPFAKQAADICGTLHHPEIIDGNVESLLSKISKHYGEPFADSSAVPSFFVCQKAREHVSVAMNGDGGDELLGGYSRYSLSPISLYLSRFFRDLPSPKQASDLAIRLSSSTALPARILRKLIMEYVRPDLRSVSMYSSFWNDVERNQLLNEAGDPGLLPKWRSAWFTEACQNANNPVDRMLWYDNRTYLPGDLMVKMDIASMHCGLETRSPLLDHEVIDFCASLPIQHKVQGQVGKYLLKKLTERYFPVEFVHRRKMGFGIPLSEWMRGPLKKVMNETLRDPVIMTPLSMKVISNTLREFEAGNGRNESRLWSLLMFGLWRKHTLDHNV